MIDFTKHIKNNIEIKRIDPIEIYDNLDRKTGAGPLRPCQERVLNKWFSDRKNDKDLIIKLYTGAGKTLIGLLMALSHMNESGEPSIFICPNVYLMQQACSEAIKFGIPYCIVSSENDIPGEFFDGKSILITYVQKVFNGLSIFGTGARSIKTNCIILDDSHACIESIIQSCTINIEKTHDLYNEILSLFESDLAEQGEGSFNDLKNGNYNIIMEVPFWSWQDKLSEVTSIISRNSNCDAIKFAWPLVRDHLSESNVYISSEKIEISPICMPIQEFGIFSRANHRILMSATTQEDTFFIKGLEFSVDSVKKPIFDEEYHWSGEKMILIPDLIFDTENIDVVKEKILKLKHDFGIAVLTPSFFKSEKYVQIGAKLINEKGTNLYQEIVDLKNAPKNKFVVLANRYDGIDLPDDACRILVMDSLPIAGSLSDRFEEKCREDSEIIKIKTIQKIEQGLGRSVRGEKDYSVILIYGMELIKYLRNSNARKLFSAQTQKQIEIGLDIVEMAKGDQSDSSIDEFGFIFSTIKQCLDRDEGWKAYYSSKMDEVSSINADKNDLYEILSLEYLANKAALLTNYDKACEYIQKIVDMCDSNYEKGWYLQQLARYKYHTNKNDSNTLQISAFKKNNNLLKPKSGIEYSKINYPVDDNRVSLIKKYIQKFENFEDFNLHIMDVLSNLSFGNDSDKFENAVMEIGSLLGYISERPDKTIRKGPDNLWCIGSHQYIMLECKSEVKDSRKSITKTEAGQFEEHCGWFEAVYGASDVLRVLIIPTKELADDAYFSHEVFIMRKKGLNSLVKKIKSFCLEFKKYDISSITDETINTSLISNGLQDALFIKDFLEKSLQK